MEIRYPEPTTSDEPIHVDGLLKSENPRTAERARHRIVVSPETLAVLLTAPGSHVERYLSSWNRSEV